MADKNMSLVMKKENEVTEMLAKNWGVYANTVPANIKPQDVNRLIFNLMRKPNSNFENLEVKAMINFALDTLEAGYDPAKEHVYAIVYGKGYGDKKTYVLNSQKGYKGVLFDLERAGIYAQYAFVHESELYQFDKPNLSISHTPSRKRVNTDITFKLDKDNNLDWETELDLIWVIYRSIETKEILDVFQMYIEDAIEHGLKYTQASPVKTSEWKNGKKVNVAPFVDKDNNWIKNTNAMIIKTALMQGIKALPTDLADALSTVNIMQDNVRYQGSQRKHAWENDTPKSVDIKDGDFTEVDDDKKPTTTGKPVTTSPVKQGQAALNLDEEDPYQ